MSTIPYLITSATTTAPPGSPTNTAYYIVPTGASGAWSGNTNSVAHYENSAWSFAVPPSGPGGMEVFVMDQGNILVWNGTSWNSGISTPVNRIAVADANYVVSAVASVIVAYTSITAARTITLPSANLSGQLVWVIDESGALTSTMSLSITAAGTDTIEGLTTFVLIGGYSAICLESSGAGKWTVQTYEELPVAVSDANYTVLFKEDCLIQVNTLTASRTITLPTATISGQKVTVMDLSGACSSMVNLIVAPNGSDTINGVNSSVILNSAYAYAAFISNGGNKWLYDSPVLTATTVVAAQLATVQPAAVAAAIGPWTAYTTTWTSSGTAPALGNGTLNAWYRRIGDSAEILIEMYSGSTTTYGSGQYFFTLPPGLVADATKVQSTSYSNVGITMASGTNTNLPMETRLASTTTLTALTGINLLGASSVTWSGAGCIIDMRATVPITTYSANINLLTNFTEYLSCNGTESNGGTAAATMYTLGAQTTYGSQGSAFPAVAITSTTTPNSNTQYNLTTNQTIQPTDLVEIDINVQSGTGGWIPLATLSSSLGSGVQNGVFIGMSCNIVGPNTIRVNFSNAGILPGTSYGSAQGTWAGITSTWRWRIRKISNGNFAQGSPSYSQTFGDGVSTVYTITHGLGVTDFDVAVWELTGQKRLITASVQISNPTTTQVTLTVASAPASNALRVDVLSSGGCAASTQNYTVYNPDAVPNSPSALDDEFSVAGLNGAWTTVNWSNLTSTDVNTTVPDSLYVDMPAEAAILTAALKSLPAGDFTIYMKGSSVQDVASPQSYMGLVLSTTSTAGTGSQYVLLFGSYSTYNRFVVTTAYTNFSTGGSSTTYQGEMAKYLRLRRVGTSYYVGWSEDGKTFTDVSIAPGFVAAYAGVVFSATNSHLVGSVEFFRYVASGAASNIPGSWQTYSSNLYTATDRLSPDVNAEFQVSSAATAIIGCSHNCVATSATYAITLPPAALCKGKKLGIRIDLSSTYGVNVTGNASELIDGLNVRFIFAGESCELKSDGVGWHKTGGLTIAMTARLNLTYPFLPIVGTLTLVPSTAGPTNAPAAFMTAASSRFTILRPGRYRISCQWVCNSTNSSASTQWVYTYVNGASISSINAVANQASNTLPCNYYDEQTLAVGAYVQPYFAWYTGTYTTSILLNFAGNSYSISEIPSW